MTDLETIAARTQIYLTDLDALSAKLLRRFRAADSDVVPLVKSEWARLDGALRGLEAVLTPPRPPGQGR